MKLYKLLTKLRVLNNNANIENSEHRQKKKKLSAHHQQIRYLKYLIYFKCISQQSKYN